MFAWFHVPTFRSIFFIHSTFFVNLFFSNSSITKVEAFYYFSSRICKIAFGFLCFSFWENCSYGSARFEFPIDAYQLHFLLQLMLLQHNIDIWVPLIASKYVPYSCTGKKVIFLGLMEFNDFMISFWLLAHTYNEPFKLYPHCWFEHTQNTVTNRIALFVNWISCGRWNGKTKEYETVAIEVNLYIFDLFEHTYDII